MENLDISRTLEETADLLEIQGANPFRIRAYRNAVRTIEGLTRSLQSMVDAGDDLTEMPGIGKEMDRHIRELLQTGQLVTLNEVTRVIPRTVAELTRLDGVGPKKAKKLYDDLHVESVEGLEAELAAGRVQQLKGFGAKSAEKIMRAIEDHRRHSGRTLRAEAEPYIESLLTHMSSAPGVERLDVAGSYRRRRETIGDIDLIASCDGDGSAVVEHFTNFPGAVRVDAAGETKGNIILRSGLSVDLRVVPSESFGAALLYFTGSKEHNVHLRTMAVKQGLRVNEWGVYRTPPGTDASTLGPREGERLAGTSEEECYAVFDLPWIPPELREDRGEIAAAAAGTLPGLIKVDDVCGDLHMHSTWSDGKDSIEQMARACLERGLEYMAITDHSRSLTMVNGLTPERVRAQWHEVAEAQSAVGDSFRILRGQEVDILREGNLDQPDDVLAELDLVIGSVHSFMDQDRDTMTNRVLRAVESGRIDVLGHPTGRLLGRREPYDLDLEVVLQACLEHDVAVEINAHPRRLDLNDRHAARARELGVRIAINTDAHEQRGLDVLRFGIDQARRAWLEPQHVVNCLPIDELLVWLRSRRSRA
jgi:DNA polymerase (family 10)